MLILFELLVLMCVLLVYITTATLMHGLQTYTGACLIDFKSLIVQVDSLAQHIDMKPLNRENIESKMFIHCKEAIDLHKRLIRFGFDFILIISSLIVQFPNSRCLDELAGFLNTGLLVAAVPATICICGSLLMIEKVVKQNRLTSRSSYYSFFSS